MGFLKSKKVGNNFEREWASSTYKPTAESLTSAGSSGIQSYLNALTGADSGAGYNQYVQSTGFNNILNNAMRGVSGSAAARGLLASGSTATALQNNASNLAQQNYSNYLQQLLIGSQTALNGGLSAGQTVLGANTYTRKGGLNDFLQSASGVAQAAGSAIAMSDPRTKENIRLIKRCDDGLGVYEFNYVGGSERMVGTMADEVERLRPEALGPVVNGFQTVDYSRLPDIAWGTANGA